MEIIIGLSRETHLRHKRSTYLCLMVMPVLDLVSRSFISSGATFEIFRLVSLGPANFLSYHSGLLAFMNVPVKTASSLSFDGKCVSDCDI